MSPVGTFDPALHPRIPKGYPMGGQFTFSTQRIENAARKAAGLPYGNMITKIAEDEGFSTSLDGKSPRGGYMVSVGGKSNEFKVPVDQLTQRDVAEYVSNNLRGLMRRGMYIGGWLDAGHACLDVSKHVMNLGEAIRLGILYKQDAIFDLNNFESLYWNESKGIYERKQE